MIKKILFGLVAVVLIWAYFALPVLGIYANDGGAKYIQMKSFYLNRWKKLNIEYPGKEIGLDLSELNPVRYFAVIDNVLYCSYLPLFTYLTSFLYPSLGDKVIHFLPLLSFFLALIVFERILKLILKEGLFYYILLITFLAASPLAFYSITFWEHLPAVLLVVSSLYFLTRYFKNNASNTNIFASSLILSASIFFRTEMIILILSYLISICWILLRRNEKKRIIAVFAGLGLPIALYLVTNYAFYGRLSGLHGVYHQPLGFSWLRSALYLVGLFVSYGLLFFLSKNKEKELMSKFYQLILLFWLGILFIKFGVSPIPALFFGFPLILVLFFDGGKTAVDLFSHKPELVHFLFGTVITFISVSAIMLYRNPDLSIRYMLPVIPLVLIFLGLKSKEIIKFKPLYALVALFVLMGLVINSYKIKNSALQIKKDNAERVEFLKSHTSEKDVVIFEYNPLMEHCGPMYFERIFIVSKTGGNDLAEILSTLKLKGINYCYYWTLSGDFSKKFSEMNDYPVEEFVLTFKDSSRHYLVKIVL
jgi:hypothetical protein